MKKYFVLLIALFFSVSIFCQKNKIFSVGFYNVENLFDIHKDTTTFDDEYSEEGSLKWDEQKYKSKINHIAYSISLMRLDKYPHPPAILGLCEVENDKCLTDLVNSKHLKNYNYKFIHYDSPYNRGVDCALIYQSDIFNVLYSFPYPLTLSNGYKSRDALLVVGLLDGEKISFIVNHWPSRRGGEERSSEGRAAAANLCRHIVDSLQQADKSAKIVVMGDLNDDPINKSVEKNLKAKGDSKSLKEGDLFNASYKSFSEGNGTLSYRGKWNHFDQIIISQSFLNKEQSGFSFMKYVVINRDFLKREEGRYKGNLKRTHAGGVYWNGYSDHLPVCIYITKKMK